MSNSQSHSLIQRLCLFAFSAILFGCGPGEPETDLRWSSIAHKAGFYPIEITSLQGPVGATPNNLVAGVYRAEGRIVWPETDPPPS